MAIKVSELMKRIHDTPLEEQEEFTQPFQDLTQKMFSDLDQKLMGVTGIAMPSITQHIQESFIPTISSILEKESFAISAFKRSIGDSFKGLMKGFMQEESEVGALYSNPSYNIVPPHILPRPQKVVYVYMYEPPSLN